MSEMKSLDSSVNNDSNGNKAVFLMENTINMPKHLLVANGIALPLATTLGLLTGLSFQNLMVIDFFSLMVSGLAGFMVALSKWDSFRVKHHDRLMHLYERSQAKAPRKMLKDASGNRGTTNTFDIYLSDPYNGDFIDSGIRPRVTSHFFKPNHILEETLVLVDGKVHMEQVVSPMPLSIWEQAYNDIMELESNASKHNVGVSS